MTLRVPENIFGTSPWRRLSSQHLRERASAATEPNGIVAPIHQKAMPVILTSADEIVTWLTAPWSEAKALQRQLPDDKLTVFPGRLQT